MKNTSGPLRGDSCIVLCKICVELHIHTVQMSEKKTVASLHDVLVAFCHAVLGEDISVGS